MEMEIAAGHDSLASRVDLLEVKSALKAEIDDLRTELKTDIADLRTELKAEIADLRAELKAEIHKIEGALSRWVLTCMLGQTAVLAGFGYFLLEHFKR
jgi:chromosome segregation ATPase